MLLDPELKFMLVGGCLVVNEGSKNFMVISTKYYNGFVFVVFYFTIILFTILLLFVALNVPFSKAVEAVITFQKFMKR